MKRKKYTSSQKRAYYFDRAYNPNKYGLLYYSPKHAYSVGFKDGAFNYSRSVTDICLEDIKKFHGNKSAYAYVMGFKKGLKNKY